MYAHIFVASLVALIRAKKEGDITSKTEDIIDQCNILHLKLLGLEPFEQNNIIAEAKVYSSRIDYEMNDLSSIHLEYHE